MANLKHIGRLKSNQRKVAVAYRVLPNDPDHCLVVDTANLSEQDHDALIALIESTTGQSAYELAEAMARSRLKDGAIMLSAFHTRGRLTRVKTDQVEMTPNTQTAVLLKDINEAVAQQKGITVADLALNEGGNPESQVQEVVKVKDLEESPVAAESQTANIQAPTDGVLSDEDLAAQYRSQADRLFKEAKALREQAEELVPTKKKKATVKE